MGNIRLARHALDETLESASTGNTICRAILHYRTLEKRHLEDILIELKMLAVWPKCADSHDFLCVGKMLGHLELRVTSVPEWPLD